MRVLPISLTIPLASLLLCAAVLAAPAPTAAPAAAVAATKPVALPADTPELRAQLAARIPGVKAEELRPSPIAGIYELTRGAEVTYISVDGRFVFTGDLYQVAESGPYPNLSDARRRELRTQLMGQLPESKMIVFAPKTAPKYTITVFTDPDCAWCRKLHSQIAEYNKLGIKVRYAFFPREGPDTEAWTKSEAVWCAANRQDALTHAKLGEKVKAAKCANTPVRQSWELGREMGVEGTPAVILADGDLIPGYLPPQQMLKKLSEVAKPVASAPAPKNR
jgi:thiol:disulfide interchange protein DsbC